MADQTIAPVTSPQVASAPVSVPVEPAATANVAPGIETSGSIDAATLAPDQGKKLYLLA